MKAFHIEKLIERSLHLWDMMLITWDRVFALSAIMDTYQRDLTVCSFGMTENFTLLWEEKFEKDLVTAAIHRYVSLLDTWSISNWSTKSFRSFVRCALPRRQASNKLMSFPSTSKNMVADGSDGNGNKTVNEYKKALGGEKYNHLKLCRQHEIW